MILSPHNIEVLLHHYCSRAPWPREDAPAYKEAMEWFICNDVISPEDGAYKVTSKGQAWVYALCNVPMPRVAFLDAQGKEIVQ